MLCNHASIPNVEVMWGQNGIAYVVAKKAIMTGEELFIDYGGDSWFVSRGIERSYRTQEADAIHDNTLSVCLSDVYISASDQMNSSGRGVFSASKVKKGNIITISPILFLPKKRFLNSELSGYLLTDPSEELAVLPIGVGALISRAVDTTIANTRVCWHDPQIAKTTTVGKNGLDNDCAEYIPDLLKGGSLSKTNLANDHQAKYCISYVATKDISIGDELYLDYDPMFNDQRHGLNEILRKGSNEFESVAASPINFHNSLFSSEFRAAEPYKDSFREDALVALTSLDVEDLRNLFSDMVVAKDKVGNEVLG